MQENIYKSPQSSVTEDAPDFFSLRFEDEIVEEQRRFGFVAVIFFLFGLVLLTVGLVIIGAAGLYIVENVLVARQHQIQGNNVYAGMAFTPVFYQTQFAFIGIWICKRSIRLILGKKWSIQKKDRKHWWFPFLYPVYIFFGTFLAMIGMTFL